MLKSIDEKVTDEVHEYHLPPVASTGPQINHGVGLKRMALNDTKAGMEGLDVQRINQIIEEASKGSKYYMHQQNQQDKLNVRIQHIQESFNNLTSEQIVNSTLVMDKMAKKMEFERVLGRTIVHVDMDAYYAAVEMRDDPTLSNVPMAVGGESMLSTSNYLARKFGVRAGMPGFIARKLCPQLVIVPTNFDKYGRISKEIHEVFRLYDPNFSSVSLDEAYLDITEYLENENGLRSDAEMVTEEEVTQEIRDKIFDKTKLTASAGIACNCLLAKICGDINKPNGQYYLPPTIEAIKEFVVKLPIRKVTGIGNVTEQLLNSLNIFNCGDLWEHRGVINLLFKPATVSFLLAVSLGIGNSWFSVSSDAVDQNQKSISSERTFSGSNTNIDPKLCHSLCGDLERELISKDLKALTVTLKIKTVDFQVKTRAVRLLTATNEADIIFETAWGIYKSLASECKDLAIRLLGVRLSNFEQSSGEETDDNNVSTSLQSTKQKKQGRIDHLLVKLNTKEVTEKKDVPRFECPICCTKFFVYNGLESHVEKCLTNTADTTSSPLETIDDGATNSSSLTKNKRKSPKSNNSNDKKRSKINPSNGHRKITDFTISGNSSDSFYKTTLPS
ncbi:DNA polymerase kappa-like [Bradysia coprophila]|uniref:DNA polymerase kappa-like n=1 Tax=Bradysia coprophila TaxID=38358 RepID=UPI00187DB655|nr:DNA polymerase kappa-like [Bradysia coprophila]XP_037051631.1 DNA polymerase kappa-like [Bradysia coprophila]